MEGEEVAPTDGRPRRVRKKNPKYNEDDEFQILTQEKSFNKYSTTKTIRNMVRNHEELSGNEG